jgi:hypothetical protein
MAFAVWLSVVTSTWPLAHPELYLHDLSNGGCTSIHFGENQLSPCSISISPLPTSPPPVLQHWWVRASMDCHIHFTLLMGSSHGFGSHRRHVRLFQTRWPCGSPPIAEVNLRRRCTRRIILQKARHQPLVQRLDSGLWLLVSTWFQGLFHPPLGVLFTFPSRYWFTIGRSK